IVASETLQSNGGYELTIDGALHQTKTVNADGSYDLLTEASGSAWGQPYASYDFTYTSAGVLDQERFYSGANGTGTIVASETIQANGGYDILHDAAGSAWGQPYASYDFGYTSAGVLDQETFYSDANGAGAIVASETLQSNGGYTLTLDGALHQTKTVNADGSYDLLTEASGSAWGQPYASYDFGYTSSGVLDQETFYSDANGAGTAVASETLLSNGGYALTIDGVLAQQKTVNSDGSYDIAHLNISGQSDVSYESVYNSGGVGSALAVDNANGTGTLTLYGAGDIVSVGPAQLSVATGADVFSLNAHITETINTSGATDAELGFTAATLVSQTWHDTVNGLVLSGAGADTLQFQMSAFGAGDAFTAWNNLVASATGSGSGPVTIHDNAGDSVMLSNVSEAMLKNDKADFKFV
ncbi:hypothetical protein, partial [Rhodoblastus sp.]|uniref:hypothetical protein n=2 Tax=Rhodoblastus sp. TaxID=1962975 RepID=UPI003F9CC12B